MEKEERETRSSGSQKQRTIEMNIIIYITGVNTVTLFFRKVFITSASDENSTKEQFAEPSSI